MDAQTAVTVETLPAEKVKAGSQAAEPKRQPPYHVVIWNDEAHTWDYVIELLMTVFGHPFEKAYQITHHANYRGRAIAFTTHRELAELKHEQIMSFGVDVRASKRTGPLRATIEPAQ